MKRTVAPILVLLLLCIPPDVARAVRGFEVRLRSTQRTPIATLEPGRDYLARLDRPRGHLLVQMNQPGNEWDRAQLEAAGVTLLQYVPDNTWMASMGRETLADRHVRDALRWAAPLAREDRLHPRLWTGAPRDWSRTASGAWLLRVRFFSDVDTEDARATLIRHGGRVTGEAEALRAFHVEIDQAGLDALAGDDDVMWICEAGPVPDPSNDDNRIITKAEIVQAAPYGLDGRGVGAAVFDVGIVDPTHPDFEGRLTIPPGAGSSVSLGHATHVGGTLAGSGAMSASAGGTPLEWRGMAPGAELISYDLLALAPYEYITRHEEAMDLGASVSNNSWGHAINEAVYGNCEQYGDYDVLAPEYDEVVAGLYGEGMVVVFSAANERDDGDCAMPDPSVTFGVIPPPATAKNVITVGATVPYTLFPAVFSSWGPVDDGRLKPELVAPGVGVVSTFPYSQAYGYYYELEGTSMAAPTVSGCLALLHERYHRSGFDVEIPSLDRALLTATARDMGTIGPDYTSGFGQIDILRVVQAVDRRDFERGSVSHGGVADRVFGVHNRQEVLRVTLAWTDPAGAHFATPAIVNDLDLVLIAPSGTVHHPWVLDPEDPAAPARQGVNSIDVIEQVLVDSPAPGTWTARVTGTDVPVGPQVYSLVGFKPPVSLGRVRKVPGDYPTVESAIAAAAPGDVVLVAPGAYTVTAVITKPIILRSESGPDVTVLEAPEPPTLARILRIKADAVIDGFTLRNGLAVGGDPAAGLGGAILVESDACTIRDCAFTGNYALGQGGAVFAMPGVNLRARRCRFAGNSAGTGGGAIGVESLAQLDVRDCLFYRNVAYAGGGAILTGSPGRIEQCTFVANGSQATLRGGAVDIFLAYMPLVDLRANIFAHNVASQAGAVWCDGQVRLACNDFWQNAGGDQVGCAPSPDDFSLDPRFCDPLADDYRIDDESPCAPGNSPGGCGRVGALEPVDCLNLALATAGSQDRRPRFALHVSTPVPAGAPVEVRFELPEEDNVRLALFDVAGRVVWKAERRFDAGAHVITREGRATGGRSAPVGVYFLELRAGSRSATRKIVVLP